MDDVCVFCGEPVFLGEHGLWHHEDAYGYVVCEIIGDPEVPAEWVVHVAVPAGKEVVLHAPDPGRVERIRQAAGDEIARRARTDPQ